MLILSYSDKPLFREALILDIKYHGLLKAFFFISFFCFSLAPHPCGGGGVLCGVRVLFGVRELLGHPKNVALRRGEIISPPPLMTRTSIKNKTWWDLSHLAPQPPPHTCVGWGVGKEIYSLIFYLYSFHAPPASVFCFCLQKKCPTHSDFFV